MSQLNLRSMDKMLRHFLRIVKPRLRQRSGPRLGQIRRNRRINHLILQQRLLLQNRSLDRRLRLILRPLGLRRRLNRLNPRPIHHIVYFRILSRRLNRPDLLRLHLILLCCAESLNHKLER